MLYRVQHNYRISQPGTLPKILGERNSGLLIEADSEEHLIEILRNKYNLNPFYLKHVTEAP